MLALILVNAGCTSAATRPSSSSPQVAAEFATRQAVPAIPAWWRGTGDPTLAALVDQGLASSEELNCRISALRRYDYETEQASKRIGVRIGRLLGDRNAQADPHARDERVERVAIQRARLARQIALVYVDVRRLQQGIAIRSELRAQFKDNAEVAQFRREAGLAPAIDGSLARSQDEIAQGELGFAQGRLGEAMGELARLVGDTPEAMATRLGASAPMPDPPLDPLAIAPQEDPRRAALADAVLREARLTQALQESRRTVRDARNAYRGGAGGFATLYVAEAAATAVNLALLDARAGRITATLDLWSGQNQDWTREGLAPMVAPSPPVTDETITVTAGCD